MIQFYISETERELGTHRDSAGFSTDPVTRRRARCTCDFAPLTLELQLLAVSRFLDPLNELQNLADRCEHLHKLCANCMSHMHTLFQRVRVDMWAKLPQFFVVAVADSGNRLTYTDWQD